MNPEAQTLSHTVSSHIFIPTKYHFLISCVNRKNIWLSWPKYPNIMIPKWKEVKQMFTNKLWEHSLLAGMKTSLHQCEDWLKSICTSSCVLPSSSICLVDLWHLSSFTLPSSLLPSPFPSLLQEDSERYSRPSRTHTVCIPPSVSIPSCVFLLLSCPPPPFFFLSGNMENINPVTQYTMLSLGFRFSKLCAEIMWSEILKLWSAEERPLFGTETGFYEYIFVTF